MKKLVKIFGAIIALLLIAMIVIPLVVDVDKYRPQIVQAANQHINGKLELGKLKLSLWGRILIRVDGVKLTDSKGTQIVSVNNAYFHVPFSSVLAGSPALNFKMEQPELNIVKNKAGKLNILDLPKTSPDKSEASPSTSPSSGKTTQGETKEVTIPAIAARARLGIELRDAHLIYKDEAQNLTSDTKNLNLIVKDLSLNHPVEIQFWADLNTQMAKVFSVKGPARLNAKVSPRFSGSHFESAQAQVEVDLDELDISASDSFHKVKGVPTHLKFKADATETSVKLDQFEAQFHNAVISAKGSAQKISDTVQNITAEISSNEIALAKWSELIPALKQTELGGTLALKAGANGPSNQLNYSAQVDLKNLTAKSPSLKSKPQIDGEIRILTDQVKDMWLTLKAPGNELKITGNVQSFTRPQISLNVNSSGMDLDQLLVPAEKKKAAMLPAIISEATASTAPPAKEDLDASLAPLRQSEAFRAMVADMRIFIKSIKTQGVTLSDINSKMTMKNLVASVEKFDLKLFGGTIGAKLSTDLKPNVPTYALNTQISKLDLKQAVTSQLELFKHTAYGNLDFSASGTGASFNSDKAKMLLNMKGNFKLTDATFTTIDVGRMVSEGLGGAIQKVGDKVPVLKGKSIGKLPNRESKYDLISSDFTIAGGKFEAPNFAAKAAKNNGVDLKGKTVVNLADNSVNARWEVVDTYNLTKARDVSVDLSGTKVDHVLAKGNDPVMFPVSLHGKLEKPDYSYSEVPEYLAGVVMGNMTGAAKSRAQEEIKKRVMGSEPAKKVLEGFGKKLFGH